MRNVVKIILIAMLMVVSTGCGTTENAASTEKTTVERKERDENEPHNLSSDAVHALSKEEFLSYFQMAILKRTKKHLMWKHMMFPIAPFGYWRMLQILVSHWIYGEKTYMK